MKYPFYCRRAKPHAAHHVKARGTWTAFDCPGRERGWWEQAIEAAFPA